MATTISTQDLENARRDIDDIGKAVNESLIVSPRYGVPFKSIPMTMAELQDAIETAASAGAGANGWTDLLIQTEDGSTQRAKNSSFQSQIDSKASTIYVDEQDAVKADKSYVDESLSQLSTLATKFYPTLAGANADIANIAINQPVQVGESGANGGLWYKATTDATTLTKSPYDPLTQAKLYSQTHFDDKTKYYSTMNLVNPAQTTEYGFFSGTSISKPAAGTGYDNYYVGLDYYPAKVGDKFWVNGIANVQFCRADKSAIGAINLNSTYVVDGILTIPSVIGSVSLATCAYIRIGTHLGQTAFENKLVNMGVGDLYPKSIPEYLNYYYGFKSKEFIQPILGEAKTEAVATIDNRVVPFFNLVNPAQTTEYGFYSGTSISKPNAGTGYDNFYVGLDYYPAKVGDKFWISGIVGAQFCRADKSVIWGDTSGFSSYTTDGIFTVPAQIGSVSLAACAYIRVGTAIGPTAFADKLVSMGVGATRPSVFPEYNTEYYEPSAAFTLGLGNTIGSQQSKLNGKKWVAMGDSITNFTYAYANQLSVRHNATLVRHSRDGARVHRTSDSDTNLILAEEYLNIDTVNPPDIITIAGGINDSIDTTLGVFSDRTKYTFYGALHVLIAGLRERFTDARIGYIAPIPTNNRYIEGDSTNIPYLKYKAIKEVCAYYSVPVWNGNTEFGASPTDLAWRDKYMPDTVHPNYDGHTWYANRVEDFILRLAK